MTAAISEATSLATWKQIAEERLVAVEMWKEHTVRNANEIERLKADKEQRDLVMAAKDEAIDGMRVDLIFLLAAIKADDPKKELEIRVNDMLAETEVGPLKDSSAASIKQLTRRKVDGTLSK